MKVKKNNLILMHQTHSNKVIEIKKNNFKKKINSDAMITKNKRYSFRCCNCRLCSYFNL